MNNDFENIWVRIISNQNKTFYTKRKIPFTYHVNGNILRPNHTNHNISKKDFYKAFVELPISGPGVINSLVRGPAYVWSILNDERII